MPRVAINKQKYLLTDLRAWISDQMRDSKKSQSYMGEMLGIKQQAFQRRLKKSNFTAAQLHIIFKELEATDEEILRYMKL